MLNFQSHDNENELRGTHGAQNDEQNNNLKNSLHA